MGPFDKLSGWWAGLRQKPQAATQDKSGGVLITTPEQLEAVMRGVMSGSGRSVTPDSAMQVSAVWACIRIISGTVANLPLNVYRHLGDRGREVARDLPLHNLLRRRPNRWQTPSQFKRDRKSTRLNSSHPVLSRMPSSA